MQHQVDYDVAMELIGHEAVIRQAYRDSVGVWTWAVGMTNATGHTVQRYIDKPAPMIHCMRVFVWALKNYSHAVDRAFAGFPISKAQYAAACSFHWNTGAIEKAEWVKLFKQGRVTEARKSMLENWDNPPEIRGRREKEAALFFDGKWSGNGVTVEYTKLTKNHTPVWKSGVKVDVSKELRQAFGEQMAVHPDVPMQPEAPVNPGATVPPADAPPPKVPTEKGEGLSPWAGAGIVAVLAAVGWLLSKLV